MYKAIKGRGGLGGASGGKEGDGPQRVLHIEDRDKARGKRESRGRRQMEEPPRGLPD